MSRRTSITQRGGTPLPQAKTNSRSDEAAEPLPTFVPAVTQRYAAKTAISPERRAELEEAEDDAE